MRDSESILLGDRPPPPPYGEHVHHQDASIKPEAEPLCAPVPARPERRRTFEIPKLKRPKQSPEQKRNHLIMRIYGHAAWIQILKGIFSIAVVGITGAMFTYNVRGAPAVATAFTLSVGCLNIIATCFSGIPRKPQTYTPNMRYLIINGVTIALWIAAISMTFYMVSKGPDWVYSQALPQKLATRLYRGKGKGMTPEQKAEKIHPHLIGTGALSVLILLLQLGQAGCMLRIYTTKFSEVQITKALESLSDVQKKKYWQKS